VLAFDADSVSAALVRRGLRTTRAVSLSSARLSDGALVPSSLVGNLHDPEGVRQAVREALDSLGQGHPRVTLVLPHGVARLAVLEVPRGQRALEYARFRFGTTLPYPVAEAMVDCVPLEDGRILAAAVRREVVAAYEEVAASAGIAGARVDLAPLAAAAAAGPIARRFPAATVFLVLGDAAASFLAYDRGRFRGLRTRRRDREGGEIDRLWLEALRTATEAGLFGEPELLVAGSGARAVVDSWAAAGRDARLLSLLPEGGPLHEAAVRPWLAAALA
jgi:hypothetical protein